MAQISTTAGGVNQTLVQNVAKHFRTTYCT